MNEQISHTCCFFGHRKIEETEELVSRLYNEIENLITSEKVDTFLFGNKSQFDDLCLEIVTDLKQKHAHIKRVYVRASFAYIDEQYTNYLLKSYDETYFPENMRGAGKALYVKRNQEMIDKSNFCIVYYDENYAPPKRKNSKRDLTDYQPKSGTRLAYEYAVKNNREIVNVLNFDN